MVFHFKITGDKLELIQVKEEAYTGNVNSYSCLCEFDREWEGLTKIAIFSDGEKSVWIEVDGNNTVSVPSELLQKETRLLVGFFADSLSENDFKRISTGFAEINVKRGAYNAEAVTPNPTEPDLWEKLINRNIPKIGENGNWQIWDINASEYRDSGFSAKPDMSVLGEAAANAISERVTVNRERLVLDDVSPLEHMVKVKVDRKNLINTRIFANTQYTVLANGRTVNVNTNGGWYSTKMNSDKPIIPKGTVVTISVALYNCNTDARLQVHLQDIANNISTTSPTFAPGTRNGKATLTTTIDVYDIFVSVNGNNSRAVIKDLQLEFGSEATEYEAYIEAVPDEVILLGENMLNCNEYSGRYDFSDIISENPESDVFLPLEFKEKTSYDISLNAVAEGNSFDGEAGVEINYTDGTVEWCFVSVAGGAVNYKYATLMTKPQKTVAAIKWYIQNRVIFSEFRLQLCEACRYSTDGKGVAELKSKAPIMRFNAVEGIIRYAEYNRDSRRVIEAAKAGLKELIDLNATAVIENTRNINNNVLDINSLRKTLEVGGNIYHDWYYENGGAGAYTATIKKDEYGIFIVTSSGSTANYTCSETGNISKSSKTHIFINTLNSKGLLHTMWHIFGGSILSMGSLQSYPTSDITITNTASGGMNVIRLPMRSPK